MISVVRSILQHARSHRLQILSRQPLVRTHASKAAPETDKSRILEKPTRFNPPSHGSRRVRPSRQYPGPRLSEQEVQSQKTRSYPNMMPPEGSFMRWFLSDRRVHLYITLSTLVFLAGYSMKQSFLHTTIYRDQLPTWGDLPRHPFQTISAFIEVYKMHVAHESEKVAEKRRRKMEDAQKRKEFMREHGVEPGFLTGSWMEKFGTVEGDKWKAEREGRIYEEGDSSQSPVDPATQGTVSMAAGSAGASIPETGAQETILNSEAQQPRREKKKVKAIFGIW